MKNILTPIIWICTAQSDITMGGKGSSGSTNTTTATENPPPQVLQAYQTATNAAQSAASQPLQQYNGSLVAGFTPDQTSAMSSIDNLQGVSQPYINQAQGLINQSTQPIWSNTQQFSPSAIQNYTNPYTQNVLGTTEAAEQNQDAQQQQQLKGNAISSGAFGGDRAGVASAVLSGQQDIANNATNANIENTGYNTGLQEFNTQQQAQLGANEANQYLAAQGAYGEGNLGNEALSTGLTGATAQLQSGELQQQLGQSALNIPYEEFEQQQAYPFQTAQYFANIAEGLGSGQGGTSTTTSPAASQSSQLLGGGILGAGALGSLFGGSGSKRGGAINGLANGGVPDVSVDFIPTTTGGGGRSTIPNPPSVQSQQQPSLSSQASNGASLGKGLGILSNLFSSKQGSSGASLGNGSSTLYNANSSDAGSLGSGAGSLFDSLGSSGSEDASSSGFGDLFSSFAEDFKRGGPPRHYKIGGDVLPDILSGVGDVVGAFFGDPAAGDQGVAALSVLDNGRTGGRGVETQALGEITGQGDSQGSGGDAGAGGVGGGAGLAASFFGRGGMPKHYDDGGDIAGGLTPLASSSSTQSPQQQTQASTYQGMTPEQLQTILMRLPAGSQQAKTAAAILQQKRMLPNTGAQASNGFTGQSQVAVTPQAAPIQNQQQQPAYGGYARGGLTPRHLDSGGDSGIPYPPSQPELESELANEGSDSQGSGLSMPNSSASSPPISSPQATRGTTRADPWQALMTMGAGIMAGQSPQAGVNIGQGALAGLKNYREQQQEANQENSNEGSLSAKNRELTQQGQYQTQDLKIKDAAAKNAAQELALRAEQIQQGKFVVTKDAFGNDRLFNTKTQQFMDVPASQASPYGMLSGNSASSTSNQALTGGVSSQQSNPAQIDAAGNANSLPQDYQDRISQFPPQVQAQIKEIIDGRIPPDRSHFGNGFQALQNAVAYVDPTFDLANPTARMKTAADFSSAGKSGQTITSLNTASKHAAQLALASLDLNNTNYPILNKAGNYLQTQIGGDPATNYNSVLDVYAPEATKVVSGKSNFAEGELNSIKSNYPPDGSPEQILGAISNTNGLMLSRAEELQNTYDSNMGPAGQHKQVVSSAAKQAFSDLDNLHGFAKEGKLNSPEAQQIVARLKQYVAGTQPQVTNWIVKNGQLVPAGGP